MQPKTILITGANGEIGHGLITKLAEQSRVRIIALDLQGVDEKLKPLCHKSIAGDITDVSKLGKLAADYDFDVIYHLAALLSTKSERQPRLAHAVNVDGTLNLLELAVTQARQQGKDVIFMYPSSIAIYGMPDLATKAKHAKVKEDQFCDPITMYGINKLYCERLGVYFQKHYRQLDAQSAQGTVDFRGVRFPGLISALTVPTGGTSDFAPEMLHAAAANRPYACFVRPDTRIPFMAMPDGVDALIQLASASKSKLTLPCYNLSSFAPSAEEVMVQTKKAFPKAEVTFAPDQKRQGIVDSWPADVDDSAARRDWNFVPTFDFQSAFEKYLIPNIAK